MDLFGPTTYKSLGGNLYCLVIVDDYSRYTWTFFLEDKSKTVGIFKIFIKQAQNEFESSVVKVWSDNVPSLGTLKLRSFATTSASSMNSLQPIHLSKME